jgi:hypothetical protein
MNRMLTALLLALGLLPPAAGAQTFDVRRMAMGGVILGGRQGGEGANVAYRALPVHYHGLHSVSLPIGLLPVLQDPPTFDARNPDFNVFEIANLVENPPWNYPLVKPDTPSNDVTFDVSRDSLHVDLGDLAKVFPDGRVRAWGVTNGPSLGLTLGRGFVAVAPMVQFENDLEPNEAITGVLRRGDPIAANAHYAVTDHARAQAAAALHLGAALPVWSAGDRQSPRRAVYAGTRFKLLRGLAYGEADNLAAYDTGDTLFGSGALDLAYTGHYFDADPSRGGWGAGADAGLLWTLGRLEVGLAVNDVGTRLPWRLRETVARRDSVTGDFVQSTVREDVAWTSTVPATTVGNVAWVGGRWSAAADVRHSPIATTAHAGLERWVGPFALRAGGSVDANRRTQLAGGLGIALGRVALDAAVATHNRNLENQRVVELGLGLEVLH